MRTFIISIIILFLVTGCKDKAISKIKTFNLIDLPEISYPTLSDLGFIEIEYIPLETDEQNLISHIETIEFGEDTFVPYRYGRSPILIYNNNGTFITNIGTIGRGPNEILIHYDLKIDKINKLIYVVCGSNINVYSTKGEFLTTFKIAIKNHPRISFSIINDNILLYYENHMGGQEYSYKVMDHDGNIIKEFQNKFPFKNYNAYGFPHENFFYKFRNRLYVKEVYSDTIYLFDDTELEFEPHMVIDVGDRLITPEARSKIEPMEIAKNYITPWYLFEFGDYIFYGFSYEIIVKFPQPIDKSFGYIGSKKNDFQVLYNLEEGIINDLDGGPNIIPVTTKDDNTVVAVIDALKLKNHISSNEFKNSEPKYPEKKKELEKLATSLKETDNPVLVLVRLKK